MANVEVILKEKIENLGAEADVVKVRSGYARNYLIPQAKAFEATKANLVHLEHLKKVRAEREGKELQEAEELAAKLKKLRLKLELATGQGGKAFGSITTQDIAKAITEKNKRITVDRHLLQLDKPIKNHGRFSIPVKLHPDVEAAVALNVVAPKEEKPEEDDKADGGK